MGEQRSAPAGAKGRGANSDVTMRAAAATSAASLPEPGDPCRLCPLPTCHTSCAPVVAAFPHRISYRRCATPGCSGWRPVVPPGCAAGWDRCAKCWRRARTGVAA